MQNRNQVFNALSLAFTYFLAGIFLCTIVPSLFTVVLCTPIFTIFGWIFIIFAFPLAISIFWHRLIPWTTRIHRWLFLALIYVTMADLIIAVLKSRESVFMVLTFLFLALTIVALSIGRIRDWTNLRTQFGNRAATAIMLRRASVVLSLVGFFMAACQINLVGGPILYLALGLAFLSIASLL